MQFPFFFILRREATSLDFIQVRDVSSFSSISSVLNTVQCANFYKTSGFWKQEKYSRFENYVNNDNFDIHIQLKQRTNPACSHPLSTEKKN